MNYFGSIPSELNAIVCSHLITVELNNFCESVIVNQEFWRQLFINKFGTIKVKIENYRSFYLNVLTYMEINDRYLYLLRRANNSQSHIPFKVYSGNIDGKRIELLRKLSKEEVIFLIYNGHIRARHPFFKSYHLFNLDIIKILIQLQLADFRTHPKIKDVIDNIVACIIGKTILEKHKNKSKEAYNILDYILNIEGYNYDGLNYLLSDKIFEASKEEQSLHFDDDICMRSLILAEMSTLISAD